MLSYRIPCFNGATIFQPWKLEPLQSTGMVWTDIANGASWKASSGEPYS